MKEDLLMSLNMDIAINQLVFSADNVRTVNAKTNYDKELIASIQANGVLQNLIVKPSKNKKFEVIAGGRRLAALKHLQKKKVFKGSDPVPCRVIEGENYAEISLTENSQRVNMHAADEFMAFQKMVDEGKTIKEIAISFGVVQNVVKRRLKLAGVSSIIIDAFKADKLSLDCVMAFTVSDDLEKQNACFNALSPNRLSARLIKGFLLENCISSDDPLVKFVGLKDYRKAGGMVTADLFSNESHLEDTALVFSLAETKLNVVKEELLAQQWKWVEIKLDGSLNLTSFHLIKATPVNVPEALTSEISLLTSRYDELNDIEFDNWTDELEKEWDTIETKLEALENKREEYAVFCDDDKVSAGCIVYVGRDGQIAIEKGLVKAKDLKKIKSDNNQTKGDTDDNRTVSDSEAYPQALQADIRLYKQQMIKSKLAANADYAKDLLTFTLSRKILINSWFNSSVDIHGRITDQETKNGDISETMAGKTLSDIYTQLDLAFIREESDTQSFVLFRALSEEMKNAILAYVTATMFTLSEVVTDELLANDLDVNYAQTWRPTSENFFSRLRKDKLLSMGQSWLGDDWAKENAKKKKSEVSDSLHQLFHGGDDLEPELVVVRQQWLPKGFNAEHS